MNLVSDRIAITNSYQVINRFFMEKKWSDGLPIVPPTIEAVETMLTGTRRDPQSVVATIPPNWSEATVEKIAINAVMAGCLPGYLNVVVAAVEAVCTESFKLYGLQATTHPAAPLIIVNGPLAKELNINASTGCFGPGWQSNATIGRALRLILMNIGGAIPGETAMSTQAQPNRYSFCIAENEDANPWQPLHVERGFQPSDSTVTACAAESPRNINERVAISGEEILTTIAGSIISTGTNNVQGQNGEPIIALGPEHAAALARDGFSKADIRSFLHAKARIPRAAFHPRAIAQYFADLDENALIPITRNREDIMLIVAGGSGKHSSFLPTLGNTRSVTKKID